MRPWRLPCGPKTEPMAPRVVQRPPRAADRPLTVVEHETDAQLENAVRDRS